jgi:NAD(P)H-dependent FMN reductase
MLLTICGSLRANSTNGRLLRAATALLPESIHVDPYDALATLPAFDPGLDLTPGPAVEDLRRRVKAASAVLIATPEYAHGVPGSLKNALDWMVGSGELIDKPVAVIVASASDGAFALRGLVEVLRTMSAKVPDELCLSVAGIRSKLGRDGSLEPDLQAQIQALLQVLLGKL